MQSTAPVQCSIDRLGPTEVPERVPLFFWHLVEDVASPARISRQEERIGVMGRGERTDQLQGVEKLKRVCERSIRISRHAQPQVHLPCRDIDAADGDALIVVFGRRGRAEFDLLEYLLKQRRLRIGPIRADRGKGSDRLRLARPGRGLDHLSHERAEALRHLLVEAMQMLAAQRGQRLDQRRYLDGSGRLFLGFDNLEDERLGAIGIILE